MRRDRSIKMLAIAVLCIMVGAQVAAAASAVNAMRRGLRQMEDEEFLPAATNFVQSAELAAGQERSPARAWFNAGNAFYRAGEYQTAREDYRKALNAEELGLQARAYYNLGNTELKMSEAALSEGEAPLALNLLEQAAANFEKSITLAPDYIDPKYNYELAGKKRYELLAKVDAVRDDIEQARRLAGTGDYRKAVELLQSRAPEHATAFQLEPDLKQRYDELQQRIGQIVAILDQLEGEQNVL